MQMLAPFIPLFRDNVEMRYLWNLPIRMDNKRLKAVFRAEPNTPLDVAVGNSSIGLGCL
jgi:hypothetical protein